MTKPSYNSRIAGFRNLTPQERWQKVVSEIGLDEADNALMDGPGALPMERANGMIENVVGTFELPMGIATNFLINGRDYLIPMAVEEPSIIAAASFMARIVREGGGFKTSSTLPIMRAQIQIIGIDDPNGAKQRILAERDNIIAAANTKDKLLVELGGGCKDIEIHVKENTPRGSMVIVHLLVDVRDAMGANAVNTMAEAVAPMLEKCSGGVARLRILSNFADLRLSRAYVAIEPEALRTKELSGEEVIEGILDAYCFATVDPYRAATHNKGIMNGIDPIVLATGNDWRAVEAGAHVWASKSGQYSPLSSWEKDAQGRLIGTMEMPMPLGLVGGATKTHPLAQLSLKILGVKTAQELGEVCMAVGLAQNMGALRALATEGIQRGHMVLHARNMAIVAGAVGDEVGIIAESLAKAGDVRADYAGELLSELRNQ
ncbi:MAG: hydroxymethylglutaryl-CoA reductase, degradative [Hyphomicrobiales bacterium]|nr:MAG: hydroxymethylglutaryl-CoA reductase, degradative [Hyphomicrobiales bacterium]